MSLSILPFRVTDLTTGRMQPTLRQLSALALSSMGSITVTEGVVEQTEVPGTPGTIASGPLVGNAHMGSGYIRLSKDNQGISEDDVLWCPLNIIRITFLGGTSSAMNCLIYAFANSSDASAVSLTWRVLFVNAGAQAIGDYFDLTIPDTTIFPAPYLALCLLNNVWSAKTVVDPVNKTCTIPGTGDYFCIKPIQSNTDISLAHSINCQGYSANAGVFTRVVLAFEDWYMSSTDRDYNDVIISVSTPNIEEARVNDTRIS